MSANNQKPNPDAGAAQPGSKPSAEAGEAVSTMTAAEAAKRVKRQVIEQVEDGKDEGGKPKFKQVVKLVAVKADEVLSFKDYGEHVVVVTKDGQKFSSVDA